MATSYKAAAIAYAAALLGFTGFLMLDTFVRSSAKQTGATEINYALFADETKETAAQTAEQSSSGTETAAGTASSTGTPGSTASSAQTGSQTAAETAGTTGAETKKRSAQTQQAYTDPLSEAYAAEESPAGSADTSASETAAPETETVTEPPVEFVNSDTVYQDENIRIEITEYTENDTAVYVADVQLSSAEYLKTAFANDTFGKNVTAKTSEIAAANNAILAVNGDFYGTHSSGYVIRNGILYRETDRANTDYLCIMADGSFFITTGAEYTAQELLDMGTWQCFMFGPRLIENGIVNVDDNSEVARAMASNPRTAIGIVDELHYLFVVSDGRTSESDGLSLSQLAEFMQRLGAQTAYNLDGGGSSTMVFNGSLINNPTTSGRSIKERSVSDIVYIGY